MNRYSYVTSPEFGAYKRVANDPRSFAKKRKNRGRLGAVKLLLVSTSFFFMTLLGFQGVKIATHSPTFGVKTIEIKTASDRTGQVIRGLLEERRGQNLLLLDTGTIKDQLMRLSEVKEVVVRKEFPAKLKVEVVERVPFLMLKNHKYFLLDTEGEIINSSYQRFPEKVPLVYFDGGDIFNLLPLKELEKFILSKSFSNSLNIYFIEPYGITVVDENHKVFLGNENLEVRWKHYCSLKGKLMKRVGEVEYFDFRWDDRVYLKPASGGING